MRPKISVVMPVFNCEAYLKQAVQSILDQTWADFELIVINDGSTDGSEKILSAFCDKRIVYATNKKNKGLVFTLNKGLEMATGAYIARMDGDDIALPGRFQKQLTLLESDNDLDMVDCVMEYIDEAGKPLNIFNSHVIAFNEIKKTLPKLNCLGHSSILIRSEVIKKYRYHKVENEDYELWLRLIADGKKISKINEPLLLYRIHSSSYANKAHKKGIQFFR